MAEQDGAVMTATEPVTVVGFLTTDLTIFDDATMSGTYYIEFL